MDIIKSFSATNKPYTEDLFGYTKNSAWVMDGATGVFKNSISNDITDAQWFVKEVDKKIREKIDDKTKSLKDILIESISFTFEIYKEKSSNDFTIKNYYPSASIIIIRKIDNFIEYLSLGDCTLLFETTNGIVKVLDETVPNLDNILIEKMQELIKKQNISLLEARLKLKDLFIANRLLKNKDGGYWILDFNKEAVKKAIYGKIQSKDVQSIAIMSDGYYLLKDTYNRYKTDEDLLVELKTKNCCELFKFITNFENEDSQCTLYPRTKKCDDATAVYIKNS